MYVYIVPFVIRNRRQGTKEFLNSEFKEFLSPLSSSALVKMCYFFFKFQFEIKKPIGSDKLKGYCYGHPQCRCSLHYSINLIVSTLHRT